MIAAIKDFISNMFAHTTKQSDVIETLAVTATGIGSDIIPSIDEMLNSYESARLSTSKPLKALSSMTRVQHKDSKDLLLKYRTFFVEILNSIPHITNVVKSQLPKVMTDTTMTYKQVAILRFCSDLSSMTLFFLDLGYAVIFDKAKTGLSKKKIEEIEEGMRTFTQMFSAYNGKVTETIKKLTKVSDEVVTRSESDVVNDIRAKSTGDIVDLPMNKGFIGNPLYTLGMWLVDRQMAKMEALKDKKRLLEMRLMELKLEAENQPSEKVSKMVEYYETQVDNVEYNIRKIKEN